MIVSENSTVEGVNTTGYENPAQLGDYIFAKDGEIYQIGSAGDLQNLAAYVNGGGIVSYSVDSDGKAVDPDGTFSGNYFYADVQATTGNAKIFKLTVPSGVEITSDAVTENYYAAGTINFDAGAGRAVASVELSGDVEITGDDIYYSVEIPAGYQLSAESAEIGGATYYRGAATLTPKVGFTGETINFTVGEEFSATAAAFDTESHYIYQSGENYLLADENSAAPHDLIHVYKITLPENLTASGETYSVGEKTYAAAGLTT